MGKLSPRCTSCPIRRSSLFKGLSKESARELEKSATANNYKAGQNIFYQNNTPFGVFHIYSGKIKLYKIGQGGNRQIVRMAKGGDILGYRAILAGEPYQASAQAIEDSVLCFIERSTFLNVLRKDTALALNTMTILSKDLRHAEERLTSAAQKKVKQRVAEALCFLLDKYGTEGNNSISIQLSREELGELADTSRETAIRILKELEAGSLIAINRRKVAILKLNRLRKLAGLAD